MASSSVNLKALGLNFQGNSLDVPDGSMAEASNVNIRRDSTVEPRRGFKLDGDSFGTVNDRLKQLFVYKDRILRHYATTLQFEDGTNNDGTRKFSNFNGSYTEAQTGLRTKSIEASGNFYFTSSEGIRKISAKTADQLSTSSGYITKAGGIKAIDLETDLVSTYGNQTGFLPEDSAVAYRVVWAKTDANDNLILGAPSERSEVYNPILSLMLQDFARLLGALDDIDQSGSLINDGDYVSTLLLESAASASELKANTIALATKIDEDILLANDTGTGAQLTIDSAAIASGTCTVTFDPSTPSSFLSAGSVIYLSGFVVTGTGDINGLQTVLAVDDSTDTITFTTTATGTVAITGAKIESGEYRNIIATGTTDYPTSLEDLVLSTTPTFIEQKTIQVTIERIILQLQEEPTAIVDAALVTSFLDPLDITTTSTVKITINIPSDVTVDNFFQIYRSSISQATGTTVLLDLTPNDEMQLVYEAYPTSAELTAKEIIVEDITPDAFRGANLYTNEATGEGALAANDSPPFAKDIGFFKNSVFFANTKTKQRKLLSMLGVSSLIEDYNNTITPKLTISDGTDTTTYTFVTGQQEITTVETVADSADSLNGKYFTFNTAYDKVEYYVWYKTSGGAESDPAPAGKTGIKVLITTNDTADTVASKTCYTIARYINDIEASVATDTITITNVEAGPATDALANTSGFTVVVTTQGRGEDAATNQVLLSTVVSPAIAVDETARSLVRVINKNSDSPIYAYYLSGAQSVPGQMLFESKNLTDDEFYIIVNNAAVGASFTPNISPTLTISSIVLGGPTVNLITTSSNHGMTEADQVMITNTTTTPVVDGLYTITYVSPTTFRINTTITVGDGSDAGACSPAVDTESSSNEEAPNRIYYSKQDQPESVPIVNFFDVGAGDKAILRILALRDSLFVFKEDGLFRVSGETTPFTQALFDNSFILLAPDSLDVCNGEIYGWTTQGISKLSEGGATPAISRPIDTQILKLASSRYTNFKTVTFGLGYESENSYLVWTLSETDDTVATICYRYNTLTNTWTTYDISNTCGTINSVDDKMYLGAGDTNYMEQERKNFDRTDFTDRESELSLDSGNYLNNFLKFSDVDGISVGDVITQNQTLTIYKFNALLEKIDTDINPTSTEYFDYLEAVAGDNMRTKLILLAQKLDADVRVASTDYEASIDSYSGSITSVSIANPTVVTTSAPHGLLTTRYVTLAGTTSTPTVVGSFGVTVTGASTFTVPVSVTTGGAGGTFVTDDDSFEDLKACFNIIVDKLNNDSSLDFTNYNDIEDDSLLEAVVLEVIPATNRVKLNNTLPFIIGPMTLYKSFESSIQYTPQIMGDPMGLKHISEATIMFENRNFTKAKLGFSTDLLPERIDVPFSGRSTGLLGHNRFGGAFFGGGANSSPFRTYVPRQCQRCRFINVRFSHQVAREQYAIFGITLTGNVSQSSRAYRG